MLRTPSLTPFDPLTAAPGAAQAAAKTEAPGIAEEIGARLRPSPLTEARARPRGFRGWSDGGGRARAFHRPEGGPASRREGETP